MLANTCLLVLLPACLPNAIINAKNQVYTRDKCGKRTLGHEIAQWDSVWNMVCRATYQLFSRNLKSILLKFSQRIWIKYCNLRVIFYKSTCFLKKYLINLGNSTLNSHLPHLWGSWWNQYLPQQPLHPTHMKGPCMCVSQKRTDYKKNHNDMFELPP